MATWQDLIDEAEDYFSKHIDSAISLTTDRTVGGLTRWIRLNDGFSADLRQHLENWLNIQRYTDEL